MSSTLGDWLNRWKLDGLSVNAGFLNLEWKPNESDRDAAWEMYVELLTRVATQHLQPADGDEATALRSVHHLFPLTREILRRNGRDCREFTRIAILVLNQIVRPFTAKWHRKELAGAFQSSGECSVFRDELAALQVQLRRYTVMLASLADVEDLTELEAPGV